MKARKGDRRGRVIDHVDKIVLEDVEFVVQEGGRQRVLEEERKNVHAFARGVISGQSPPEDTEGAQVTYNPYEYDSFVLAESGKPVGQAEIAVVSWDTGVRAFGVGQE